MSNAILLKNWTMDMTKSLRKLRGIYSDALRAASCSGEFIACGQANTPSSMIGDWSVSRKRNAPGIVPPSHRRSGCSPAVPYPPARQIDCLQETGRKSIIEFNLHRDLYRRGAHMLTTNKERT